MACDCFATVSVNYLFFVGIINKQLTARKVYFLIGYTEEMLSYWLKCPVKLELQENLHFYFFFRLVRNILQSKYIGFNACVTKDLANCRTDWFFCSEISVSSTGGFYMGAMGKGRSYLPRKIVNGKLKHLPN